MHRTETLGLKSANVTDIDATMLNSTLVKTHLGVQEMMSLQVCDGTGNYNMNNMCNKAKYLF